MNKFKFYGCLGILAASFTFCACGDDDDNGKETVINAGKVAITPAGTGHSIKNESNEDVELIALIVYS